jgi:D-alanyl-D-alanine carboxypeptidase
VIVRTTKPTKLQDRLRRTSVAWVLAGFFGFVAVGHAQTNTTAAIVIDANNGQVINAVNADQAAYPASLAKMMTLYLTFQALDTGKLKIDQELPVSDYAASQAPTKLDLRPGQTISVEDCILGMVTKSANDAAEVAAEGVAGSESDFTSMMNAQAILLGMSDSHFDNANGLPDPDNITTARDMAKLAMALYRDFPQYSHYFATKEFVFRGQLIRGHNNLMDRYPGMDGLKTGFTDASGFNLASTAVRDGHRLFAVVLGGRTASARDHLMARLLDDGFDGQQTPADLVAEVGLPSRPSAARRMLAALSPIGTAEAETVSLPPRAHRKAPVASSRKTCTVRHGVVCPRTAQASAPAHGTTKLAHRKTTKKPVMLASRNKTTE